MIDILQCGWTNSHFLLFSGNVFSDLIYYSHLFAGLASLTLGISIYISNRNSLSARVFLGLVFTFAVWVFSDLVLWADADPSNIMFFWSVANLIEPFVYVFSLYFLITYGDEKDAGRKTKIALIALVTPTILLTPTSLGLLGFNYTNCDREVVEGLLVYYGYFIELCVSFWAVIYSLRKYKTLLSSKKREFFIVTFGMILFLLIFASGNIVGSISENWTIGQYGLFGMPLFLAFMTYALSRYQVFKSKIFGAQLLIGAVWVLVGSLLFIVDLSLMRTLVTITLLALIPFGILLVRGVKKEIALSTELQLANTRQQETMRFVTHEVKGYLTDGAAALDALRTGAFGPATPDMRTMIGEALVKNRAAVREIQNFLRIADFKTGKVAYGMKQFDFKKMLDESLVTPTENAKAKGLTFTIDIAPADYTMVGDGDQVLNHVIVNLVNNAINYTPTGNVVVRLERKANTIHVSVKDSGVGLTEDDKKVLFTEGGHGKESRLVNPHSTGYGLFIAKQIVDAHQGKIWAESAGRGTGATFFVELPTNLRPTLSALGQK